MPRKKRLPTADEIDQAVDASRASGSIVYFVGSGSAVKIGHTKNLRKRISEIQISVPTTVEYLGGIPGDKTIERVLHHRWRHYKRRGEWFDLAPAVAKFIAEHAWEIERPAPIQKKLKLNQQR